MYQLFGISHLLIISYCASSNYLAIAYLPIIWLLVIDQLLSYCASNSYLSLGNRLIISLLHVDKLFG